MIARRMGRPLTEGEMNQMWRVEEATVFTATPILPCLFLGALSDIQDITVLKRHQIGAVLNMNGEDREHVPPHWVLDNPDIKYLYGKLYDSSDIDLKPFLQPALAFIVENLLVRNRNVVVNCLLGKSRSAAIVIAFIMWFRQLSFDKAHAMVKEKRPIIQPNLGFVLALEHYEEWIHDLTFPGITIPKKYKPKKPDVKPITLTWGSCQP